MHPSPKMCSQMLFIQFFTTGQYIGDPIDCFTPGEFTPQWSKYTDQYCWVKNTYYVPYTEDVPDHQLRKGAGIVWSISFSIDTCIRISSIFTSQVRNGTLTIFTNK